MNSPMAVRRDEERFPVHLCYGGSPQKYAKGGLAKSAMAVKNAGRMGDTELVHVNRAEFEDLKRQYGEPTINPETGQPEFFLGFLKKLIAPILSIALPGIGTAVGGALGVGGTAGGLIANTALGTLQGVAEGQPFGKALVGSALNAGIGAGLGAAGNAMGNTNKLAGSAGLAGTKPAIPQSATNPRLAAIGGDQGIFVNTNNLPGMGGPVASPTGSLPSMNPASTSAGPASLMKFGDDAAAAIRNQAYAPTAPAKPNFWNRDFLGIKGIPNKWGIPLTALAVGALAGGGGGGGDSGPPSQEEQNKFLNPVFKSSGRSPTGFYNNLSPSNARAPIEAYYRAGSRPEQAYFDYVQHLAGGGPVDDMAVKGRGHNLAVQADGRSDDIPAKLSDGEYVMDAESVSMLGNGSNKAGADKLDGLRVKLRKHKGKALAKGKISPNAKEPDSYMRGGRG